MDVKKSEIAEEISRLCEERNITSYELAKRSGLQESSVRNMFQKGTTPTYRTLLKICEGLGLTISGKTSYRRKGTDEHLSEAGSERSRSSCCLCQKTDRTKRKRNYLVKADDLCYTDNGSEMFLDRYPFITTNWRFL